MPDAMDHFSRATFRFLRDLSEHNEIAWFHAHRPQYDRHVRDPARSVATRWLDRLPRHYVGAGAGGNPVAPPHRDTRFSRDKRPYRTHIAIRIRHRLWLPGAPGPAFLLRIDPAGSTLRAGVRNVSGESRRRIVASILADPHAWNEARAGLELEPSDTFATAPPAPEGFEDDVRLRHYTVDVPIPQRVLTDGGLVDHLDALCQTLLPLNEFLAEALYGERAIVTPSK